MSKPSEAQEQIRHLQLETEDREVVDSIARKLSGLTLRLMHQGTWDTYKRCTLA
eukprot:CAMPEP_0172905496 /NCGR_PEP_ID=MMETSP1075-20121228/174775_1 /TAXON_ID=2916 /ORGANISM="Ceratium fusus, Strain PA161109" /LENGTH=53 /DNA_ID=CAMNT_0013762737 /DNA_START=51 /DNA_END=209 /DNA_ORIENTATION=+